MQVALAKLYPDTTHPSATPWLEGGVTDILAQQVFACDL